MAVAVVLVNLVSSSASANRIYGRWSLAHSLTHSLAHSLSHSQLNNREHCQLVTMHWAGSLSLSCCCCWAELSNKLAWQKRFGHCDSPHWYGDGVCKCASVCLCRQWKAYVDDQHCFVVCVCVCWSSPHRHQKATVTEAAPAATAPFSLYSSVETRGTQKAIKRHSEEYN